MKHTHTSNSIFTDVQSAWRKHNEDIKTQTYSRATLKRIVRSTRAILSFVGPRESWNAVD